MEALTKRKRRLVVVEGAGIGEGGQLIPTNLLVEILEWCSANPEKVIAFGVSIILLGILLELLRG
ncbi:MAG: hypothetical protein ACXQTS_02445 [Candidatus Methanospirareceae archaeon]